MKKEEEEEQDEEIKRETCMSYVTTPKDMWNKTIQLAIRRRFPTSEQEKDNKFNHVSLVRHMRDKDTTV